MKAVLCPVCNGEGKIGWDKDIICHGCDGKGWLEVHEEFCQPSPVTLPALHPYITITQGWSEELCQP